MFNRVRRHSDGLSRAASPLFPVSPVGGTTAVLIGKPQTTDARRAMR